MPEHSRIVRITTFVPADGRHDDLVSACEQIATTLRRTDGCFGAQICTVAEEPTLITAISRWRDQDALDTYGSAAGGPQIPAELLGAQPVTRHHLALS